MKQWPKDVVGKAVVVLERASRDLLASGCEARPQTACRARTAAHQSGSVRSAWL